MADPKVFNAADPNDLFHLQMSALVAKKTLTLNLPDEMVAPDFERSENFDLPSQIAKIFAEAPAEHTAIRFHTSGSTGEPKPVPHTWRHLVGDARAIASSVGITQDMQLSTVLTVPLDHMFGYSYGFMLTNLFGFDRPEERVVAPKSLLGALERAPHPVLLVTTPVHLRTYVESNTSQFPNVNWIFSATSPLPDGLSEQVFQKFGTHIIDIYGCTEAGTLAFRDMSDPEAHWQCLDGMTMTQINGQSIFETDYFDEPVIIDDVLKITGKQRFDYVGRSSDLVKIGGKRQSMTGLSKIVENLPYVREAKFFLPNNEPNARLVLFAVFDGEEDFDGVRKALAGKVDHVFIPRQCYALASLPYTSIGKLRHSDLTALYREKSKKAAVK